MANIFMVCFYVDYFVEFPQKVKDLLLLLQWFFFLRKNCFRPKHHSLKWPQGTLQCLVIYLCQICGHSSKIKRFMLDEIHEKNYKGFLIHIANFEAFCWKISLSANLLFLKGGRRICLFTQLENRSILQESHNVIFSQIFF